MKIETLIQNCKSGDRKAQFTLYKTYYNVLMSVCMRYNKNKDDASAILNEGFLKILKNLDKYDPKIPFEAWIKRIMINTIIDAFRKNKKERELVQYTDFEETDTLDINIDYNEADKMFDAEAIERLIQKLPPATQKVFNLFAVDGFSHKEIGKMLNMSVGTSKWHISSARKQLKEMIYNKTSKTV